MANHWYAYSCVGGSLDGKQILLQPPRLSSPIAGNTVTIQSHGDRA